MGRKHSGHGRLQENVGFRVRFGKINENCYIKNKKNNTVKSERIMYFQGTSIFWSKLWVRVPVDMGRFFFVLRGEARRRGPGDDRTSRQVLQRCNKQCAATRLQPHTKLNNKNTQQWLSIFFLLLVPALVALYSEQPQRNTFLPSSCQFSFGGSCS